MATWALELVMIVLFSIVKTETNGRIITAPVELHTTVDFPCNCTICPESSIAVQWYKSSNSDVYVKDGKAVAWWSVGITGHSQGFGIKADFSMSIYNLTDQHDQELYRCIVIPIGDAAHCTHDVKLGIYANPNTSPVIEYIRQTNGYNVTCSISNIFPMTFPILTTKEGIVTEYNKRERTYNSDGTFNTIVTHLIPTNEKDTIIECLYSNLNFKSVSSLRIAESGTIDQPEEGDGMQKNMEHTDLKRAPSGLWMVWMIFIIEVLFSIVIAIKMGRVLLNHALRKTIQKNTADIDQDEHLRENSKEEEPAKSTRILLFGKLAYAVITLTIQTIVLIFVVAYLSTARCSNEPGVKLEGSVPAE